MPNSDLSKSDKDWINKYMEGFPKFQFSFFPHGKDGEQIVVRDNDFTEFVADIEQVKSQFNHTMPDTRTVSTTAVAQTSTTAPVNPKRICTACGVEMEYRTGESKKIDKNTGEPISWKGWFCKAKCGAAPVWV